MTKVPKERRRETRKTEGVSWKQLLSDAVESLTDAIATFNDPVQTKETTAFYLSDVADTKMALDALLEDEKAPEKIKKKIYEALLTLADPAKNEEEALLHALSLIEEARP